MNSFEVYKGSSSAFPEEEHPLTIYTKGSAEMRRDVILYHDEVSGFLFLHEGVVQKAHLPKKITNSRRFPNGTLSPQSPVLRPSILRSVC